MLSTRVHKKYNSGEHLFGVQKLGAGYNPNKVVDQIIVALHHVALLSTSYFLDHSPHFTARSSPSLPMHAAPRAFHAGTVGQLRTYFSLDNVFIGIPLALVADL